jgi:hypothetical protein
MKNKFTKIMYRSLNTGNEVKRVNKVWIDLKTKEMVPNYRVHKYVSLYSKLITN